MEVPWLRRTTSSLRRLWRWEWLPHWRARRLATSTAMGGCRFATSIRSATAYLSRQAPWMDSTRILASTVMPGAKTK